MIATTPRIAALAALLLLLHAPVALALLPAALHSYGLNIDYMDEVPGGPEIVPLGGYLANGAYVINATNGGLYLPPGSVPDVYSMDMRIQPAQVGGYRKLIDFNNRTSDAGLYIFSGGVYLWPRVHVPGRIFVAKKPTHILMTRSVTGKVVVYVNGRSLITYDDSVGSKFVFSAAGVAMPAYFLVDDFATSGTEATTGKVTRIRVFNAALTAPQAQQLAKGIKPPNVMQT